MKRVSILLLLLFSFSIAQEKRHSEHQRLVAERKRQIEEYKKLQTELVEKARQEVLTSPESAEAHFRLADALSKNTMSSDSYKEIEEEYIKAIQLKSDCAEAYLGLAFVQRLFSQYEDYQSKYKANLETLNKAILFKPDYAEAYSRLGDAYLDPVLGEEREFDIKQQAKLAAKAFNKATQIKPDLGEAYTGLGLSNYYLEQYKEAAEAFKKAVLLNQNDYLSHKALGDLYIRFGQKQEAMQEYESLIRIAEQIRVEFEAMGLPGDYNPAKGYADTMLEEIRIRFEGKRRPKYQITNTNMRLK